MSSPLALAARRLLPRYVPSAWIGSVRLAFEAGELAEQGVIAPSTQHFPAHYLIALWEPLASDKPVLARWPALAASASPDSEAALLELVAHLPAGARVWLADEAVDWALIAEIVLRTDRNLAAYHRIELQRFIGRCRADDEKRIAAEYSDRDAGYEAFRTRLVPGAD